MKFSDFIHSDAIISDLEATTRDDAIREIVETLAKACDYSEEWVDVISDAVLERDKLASTAIGDGIAIPHASKQQEVDRLVGAVAISRDGVDFCASDGEPVHTLFLVVSPIETAGAHLIALGYVASQLRDTEFVENLRNAAPREDLKAVLDAADAAHSASAD